ncbi:MAG: hypothetical protein ACYC7H_14235, partial [Chloroflexota bacterium]
TGQSCIQMAHMPLIDDTSFVLTWVPVVERAFSKTSPTAILLARFAPLPADGQSKAIIPK